MNKLIKPAKKILSLKYGHKNVSVKNGQGTAWGWVNVNIDYPKSAVQCLGDTPFYCSNCSKAIQAISEEAEQLMNIAWQEAGVKPYSFCSDNNSSEINEVIVQVHYI